MNPAQNIVIALFLTIQLGTGGNRIYIKPSISTLPEIIFTNQANYDLSRKNKVIRTNPLAIQVYHKKNGNHPEKEFKIEVTLPELVAVFHPGNGHERPKFNAIGKFSTNNRKTSEPFILLKPEETIALRMDNKTDW